jgi:stage V sporulation protein B
VGDFPSSVKSRPLAGNIAKLTVVHGLSLAGGFLASVLGARLLGADGMGTVGLVLTVAMLAAIVMGGGLGMAAVYYLNRRPDERAAAVGRLILLGLLVTVLDLALVGGLAILIAPAVPELGAAILVASPLSASILAFELGGAILLGLGAERAFIGVHLAEVAIGLVATAAWLLLVSADPTGFLAATTLGYLAACVIAFALIRRRVGAIRPQWSAAHARELFSFGVRGQVGNTIQFVNVRLDLILVSALVGFTAAGLYYIATRVAEALLLGAQAGASLLFPRVAAQADRGATESTETLVRRTLIVVGAGALAMLVAGELLIRMVFGDEFATAAPAARILAVAMVPFAVHRLLAGDLRGRGRPGLGSASSALALAATIVLDLALIPPFGIVGAAIASLGAYLVASLAMVVFYVRTTGASAKRLVPRSSDLGALVRAAFETAGAGRRPSA